MSGYDEMMKQAKQEAAEADAKEAEMLENMQKYHDRPDVKVMWDNADSE